MRKSWLWLLPTIVLLLGIYVIWSPVPSFLTNQIPVLIESQLPAGWKITKWEFRRFWLFEISQGLLPQISLVISHQQMTIPMEVKAKWNRDFKNPEIEIKFETQLTSPWLTTSKIRGTGYIQLGENFSAFRSWTLAVPHQEKIDIRPFGQLKDFSLIAVEPAGQPLNGNLQLGQLDLSLGQGLEKIAVVAHGMRAGFVINRSRQHLFDILQNVSVTLASAQVKTADRRTDFGTLSMDLSPTATNALAQSPVKNIGVSLTTAAGTYPTATEPWTYELKDLTIRARLSQPSLQYAAEESTVNLAMLALKQGDSKDLTFENLVLTGHGSQEKAAVDLSIGAAAMLWGELLYLLPTGGTKFSFAKDKSNYQLNNTGILKSPIRLQTACPADCTVTWQLASDISDDMKTYGQMSPDHQGFAFAGGGQWSAKGSLQLNPLLQPQWSTLSNTVVVKNGYFVMGNFAALNNISLHWPIVGKGSSTATLAIGNLQFKNFKGGMGSHPWQWKYDLAKGQFALSIANIPLLGDLRAINFSKLNLNFHDAEKFDFAGTITAEFKDGRPYLEKMCVGKAASLPPISLRIAYPEIIGTAKNVIFRGQSEFGIFSGTGLLKDLKIFDWRTAVPETQFNFTTENLQLADIGSFFNFGKMAGQLGASAENVVMQSLLPTQFRAKIALLPLASNDEVIFSSKAMQNFTQLFTPQDFLKQIPSLLRWFTFGWPSDAIGGFNIQYGGISLYAKDGSVLLETLDPPEIVGKEGGHFLLYGYRFKIPINYWSYPVVLDHQGMSQFISHMYSYLLALKAQQNEQSPANGESNETEKWCKYELDGIKPH